jgi:hypothetical protein
MTRKLTLAPCFVKMGVTSTFPSQRLQFLVWWRFVAQIHLLRIAPAPPYAGAVFLV